MLSSLLFCLICKTARTSATLDDFDHALSMTATLKSLWAPDSCRHTKAQSDGAQWSGVYLIMTQVLLKHWPEKRVLQKLTTAADFSWKCWRLFAYYTPPSSPMYYSTTLGTSTAVPSRRGKAVDCGTKIIVVACGRSHS